jgi:hypothetical protein
LVRLDVRDEESVSVSVTPALGSLLFGSHDCGPIPNLSPGDGQTPGTKAFFAKLQTPWLDPNDQRPFADETGRLEHQPPLAINQSCHDSFFSEYINHTSAGVEVVLSGWVLTPT